MSDIDPQNPSPAADPTPFAPPSPPPGYPSPGYPAAQPPAPTQQPYAAQPYAAPQPYPGQQPYAGQQPSPGQQPYVGQQPGYPPPPGAYPQAAAYPPPAGYQPNPYGQAGGYGPGGTAYPAQLTTRPLAPSKVSPIMLLVTSALGVLLSGIVGPPSLVMAIIALMRGSTDPAKATRTTKLGWIVLAVNAVVGIPLIVLLIIWLRR